jgi:hypothetical protein
MIKSSLMLWVMQASNSYREFESWSVRQRGCELSLCGSQPAEAAQFIGAFALEIDPERRHFGGRFQPLEAFSLGFLWRMVVEWWFAMHCGVCVQGGKRSFSWISR